MTTTTASTPSNGSRLRSRLLPLHIAVFLQGFAFWVPVEKLFMNEIGFTAASIGLMAAAYAAVVPLLEVPSGILADRWSRRGVLVVSSAALTVSALFGGLSHDVPTYVLSALVLGVFFAMSSGTLDSVVYDTVLEETGDSAAFERQLGHSRLVNSAAMVLSSLLGGGLAALLGTRATYLLTVPVAVLSIVALLRFTEPTLHRPAEPTPLRAHLALTYRALARRGRLLPIVTLSVLAGLVLQVVLEFGPLWLVALAAPAALYGPYWAGVVSALGLGGLVAGRFPLGRPRAAAVAAALMVLAGVALSTSSHVVVVAVAQVLLALLVVAAGIHVARLLHDAVPSTVRAGVASGVSTLTWLVFLPVALGIGLLTEQQGVHASGFLVTAFAAASGGLLVATALRGGAAQTCDAAS
ncbi:MFS transporter [Pseudonocardia kunmingensis]|uniref:Putative MFS family arabinose efflux permease n=1 Tax=Pseudonocardia kunmingensis TaxID=630975 RepID=A0A543DYT7_9PSEU|nr:MFS transporter [Pseudonocardia kunmingensis]TQM14493.1 putative MFS family arabinose efflux permease [Pseudonocardia kunmingensis]